MLIIILFLIIEGLCFNVINIDLEKQIRDIENKIREGNILVEAYRLEIEQILNGF